MESELCEVAPLEWKRLPIEAVCRRVTSGGTPSRKRPDFYTNGKWHWVKTQELKDGWIDETEESITDEALASSSAKLLPPNTVLLALYGATVGQLGILRHEMTCNQACCAMVVDPVRTDYRFLFYQLRLSRPQLRSLATGAAQQNLSGQLLKSYKLPFPPLKEQKAIACILGTLDDKIELNRQLNRTMEEMARAIFKSWFVNFDPVRAKAAGQQPPGLKPEIAALFPDTFDDSELGEIPKGWRVGVVGDISVQTIGGQWGTDNYEKGLIPSICLRGCDMEDLRSGGFAPAAPIRFVKPKVIDTRLPSDKDVLIAASGAGPCGRPLWCSPSLHELFEVPLIYSNFVKRLTTPSTAHAVYLDRVLIQKFEDRTIHDFINGTSVPNLDAAGLLSGCPILIPSDDVLNVFLSFCQPIFTKLYSRDNVTLAALRDTLLPKLISGELRLPDAERIAGRLL